MPRLIYDYTKLELESVSFDQSLFKRKLKKALNSLLPYELEQLIKWLIYFTSNKPHLKECLVELDIEKGAY